MKLRLIFSFFLICITCVQAEETRKFDEDAIQKYKGLNDFSWEENASEGIGPMEYLWYRFLELLGNLLTFKGGVDVSSILFYAILIGILVYALIVILKIDTTGLFARKKQTCLNSLDLHNHNIYEVDYPKLISEALSKDNFKIAIRLNYLHTLKILSLEGAINWKPWSTANDYLYQLEKELKPNFSDLNRIFSFVWYGEFDAGKAEFEESNVLKERIAKQVKS
ncbi:MAG: hypothetical protein AAF363_17010 [Bacteroidota bacterium]